MPAGPSQRDLLHERLAQVRFGRRGRPVGGPFAEPAHPGPTQDHREEKEHQRVHPCQSLVLDDDIRDRGCDEPGLRHDKKCGGAAQQNGDHQVPTCATACSAAAGDRSGLTACWPPPREMGSGWLVLPCRMSVDRIRSPFSTQAGRVQNGSTRHVRRPQNRRRDATARGVRFLGDARRCHRPDCTSIRSSFCATCRAA